MVKLEKKIKLNPAKLKDKLFLLRIYNFNVKRGNLPVNADKLKESSSVTVTNTLLLSQSASVSPLQRATTVPVYPPPETSKKLVHNLANWYKCCQALS